MRVTFLIPEFNLEAGGGSHHGLHLTASELSRLGHQVRVISLGASRTGVRDRPYEVEDTPGLEGATRMSRMKDLSELMHRRSDQTDIFHLYSPVLAPAGGIYRHAGGPTPTVVTLNSYTLWCTNVDRMDDACHRRCGLVQRVLHSPRGPVRKVLSIPVRAHEQWLGLRQISNLDHFFPDSPAVQRIYAEAGFDMAKSTVIPEVIDFHALRDVGRVARPRASRPVSGRWSILFAGRLVPPKGVDVLINALALVQTPVHLHIVGDGPARGALHAQVRRLGLQDRVTFHGWVPNQHLWHLVGGIDLFVHPGRWPEPCGRTVQEALALGVPSIVSDTGGPPWLLGRFGRTFRPNDHVHLAEQITECCEHYDEALRAAAEGVERAAEFDVRRIVPALARAYERLANS